MQTLFRLKSQLFPFGGDGLWNRDHDHQLHRVHTDGGHNSDDGGNVDMHANGLDNYQFSFDTMSLLMDVHRSHCQLVSSTRIQREQVAVLKNRINELKSRVREREVLLSLVASELGQAQQYPCLWGEQSFIEDNTDDFFDFDQIDKNFVDFSSLVSLKGSLMEALSKRMSLIGLVNELEKKKSLLLEATLRERQEWISYKQSISSVCKAISSLVSKPASKDSKSLLKINGPVMDEEMNGATK